MTKKDLLEAIEDMPMDAEVWVSDWEYGCEPIRDVKLNYTGDILLCTTEQ